MIPMRKLALLLVPLLSSCALAQTTIDYEVLGGAANPLCEQYRIDLSEAVNNSSSGGFKSAPFVDFEEVSTVPVERFPRLIRSATDIGGLKLDLNNDGETEQLYRSIVMQITQRAGEVVGYKSLEYISIFFTGYPRQQGSTDLPASAILYDPSGTNLRPWEDLLPLYYVINPRLPTVEKVFPEKYEPQLSSFNVQETVTFAYQKNSRNYLSINNHNLSMQEKDRAVGASYFIKRSLLVEYDQARKVSLLCLIESPATQLVDIVSIDGGSGNDLITGSAQADVIIGNTGHDTLSGGGGGDTYMFSLEAGYDVIQELANVSEIDVIKMGAGIGKLDLWFTRQNNDLLIHQVGRLDRITVKDWYLHNGSEIERIEAGGFYIEAADVEVLVTAMSSFTPPVGLTGVMTQEMLDGLASTSSSTWQTI